MRAHRAEVPLTAAWQGPFVEKTDRPRDGKDDDGAGCPGAQGAPFSRRRTFQSDTSIGRMEGRIVASEEDMVGQLLQTTIKMNPEPLDHVPHHLNVLSEAWEQAARETGG